MAIARGSRRPTKKDRTNKHIEDLKRKIQGAYGDVEFEVGSVPESRWPGLFVYTKVDDPYEVWDLLAKERERFLEKEAMSVHVIVLGLKENGI